MSKYTKELLNHWFSDLVCLHLMPADLERVTLESCIIAPVQLVWKETCFLMREMIEDDETGAGAVAIAVVSSQPAPQSCLHREEGVSCCLSVPSLKTTKDLHSAVSNRRPQVRQPPHDIPHYRNPTDWTVVIYPGQRWGFVSLKSVHELRMSGSFGETDRANLKSWHELLHGDRKHRGKQCSCQSQRR